MAKVNQCWSGGSKVPSSLSVSKSKAIPVPVSLVESSDSSTDFEFFDEEVEKAVQLQEAKSLWQSQFQHLLQFSEDILPAALHEPMKWCHVSLRDSLKHIAKTEQILANMTDKDVTLLEMQLKAWRDRPQSSFVSKSRLPYSPSLYRHAGDLFYFACFQNREFPPEVRERMESLFEAQFGSRRLQRARAQLQLYLRHFSQIEDFLSLLPELYRSEVLADLICTHLNALGRDEREGGVLEEKINELVSSPDYHENQISLMLLTRQDCQFKQIILDTIIKYVITDPQENCDTAGVVGVVAGRSSPTSTRMEHSCLEDITRYRLKLFLEAEPDLLVKACLATEQFSPPLLEIIVMGLDIISVPVTTKRSLIFQDFRPPLFGHDSEYSFPPKYFTFFQKMSQAPSTTSLLNKVKTALESCKREAVVNKDFWIELFVLLNDNHNPDGDEDNADSYRYLCHN